MLCGLEDDATSLSTDTNSVINTKADIDLLHYLVNHTNSPVSSSITALYFICLESNERHPVWSHSKYPPLLLLLVVVVVAFVVAVSKDADIVAVNTYAIGA